MKFTDAKIFLNKKRPYVRKRFIKSRDLMREVKPKIVLDVGCGNGLLLSLCGDDIEKHGIDIVDKCLPDNERILYAQDDVAEGIPYENSKFDVVHSSELIEHLKDTKFFLEECYRVLKPGGRLIISTPNLHYWRNIVEWFKGNQFFFVDYHDAQEGHMRYFCPKTLYDLSISVGFINITTMTIGDWGSKNIIMIALAKIFEKFFYQKNMILFMVANKNR
jgi:2-polyprenyl-3-methyl-5-hydroxy-6-metoxy-1,4-benzoquinol methylase